MGILLERRSNSLSPRVLVKAADLSIKSAVSLIVEYRQGVIKDIVLFNVTSDITITVNYKRFTWKVIFNVITILTIVN